MPSNLEIYIVKFLITELEEMLQLKKRKPRKKKQPLDVANVGQALDVNIM